MFKLRLGIATQDQLPSARRPASFAAKTRTFRDVDADTHAMAHPSTSYVSGERCFGS